MDDSITTRIDALETEIRTLKSLLEILWKTRGSNGSFRFFCKPGRFANEQEVEQYLMSKVPSVCGVIVASGDDVGKGSTQHL